MRGSMDFLVHPELQPMKAASNFKDITQVVLTSAFVAQAFEHMLYNNKLVKLCNQENYTTVHDNTHLC